MHTHRSHPKISPHLTSSQPSLLLTAPAGSPPQLTPAPPSSLSLGLPLKGAAAMGPPKAQVTCRASPQLTPQLQLRSPLHLLRCAASPPTCLSGPGLRTPVAPAQGLALLPPTVRTDRGSSQLHGPPACTRWARMCRAVLTSCPGHCSHAVISDIIQVLDPQEEMTALLLLQTQLSGMQIATPFPVGKSLGCLPPRMLEEQPCPLWPIPIRILSVPSLGLSPPPALQNEAAV